MIPAEKFMRCWEGDYSLTAEEVDALTQAYLYSMPNPSR
jgi:hypothetical protein